MKQRGFRLSFDWNLYGGLALVLLLRHCGLRYWGAAPEASQVALFITFFLIGAIHAATYFGVFRATAVAVAVAVLWWGAEWLGLRTGLVFGRYHYAGILGPTISGVPIIIPLVWFAMFYAARWTALLAFDPSAAGTPLRFEPRRRSPRLIVVTAALMTLWDLAMDYNQVALGQWLWDPPGWWFGIPVRNFIGWFAVACVIQLCIIPLARCPASFPLARALPAALFFLSICTLAVVQTLVNRQPLLAGAVAVPLVAIIYRIARRLGK